MPEDDDSFGERPGRRRPPWWFMPVVMAGIGTAAALLAMTMMTVVD